MEPELTTLHVTARLDSREEDAILTVTSLLGLQDA